MSILRTLQEHWHGGEIALLYYTRTLEDACYREQLAIMPDVTVLHGCTRSRGGDVEGHFDERHLVAAMPDPDAVYVCGPPALVEAVRRYYPAAVAESFASAAPVVPDAPATGRITFSRSGIGVDNDGQPLLSQAEAAGLTPQSGCRMGICHTCTRRKVHGVVRNVSTGALSAEDDEAVRICVSAPVGDVEIDI